MERMKIETPKQFQEWFDEYRNSANFFMAKKGDDHGLFLSLRDAFIAGAKIEHGPTCGCNDCYVKQYLKETK